MLDHREIKKDKDIKFQHRQELQLKHEMEKQSQELLKLFNILMEQRNKMNKFIHPDLSLQ